VPEKESGVRLDVFCTHKIEGYTRSFFTKLAAAGFITLADLPLKASYKVKPGDQIKVEITPPPPIEAIPEEIPLEIEYEDEWLMVVNKPSDMVCHPAAGNYTGTLINGLLFYFKELQEFSDKLRPGLVHRLDKDTSGLLIISKNEQTLALLQKMMTKREIKRHYKALVWGKLGQTSGVIDLPLGRSPSERKKMSVYGTKNREAVTHYQVIREFDFAELLEVRLQTGRTHQIRVHLSYYGHPIIGDYTYGGRSRMIKQMKRIQQDINLSLLRILDSQALHAYRLEFTHPHTNKSIRIESDLPDNFQQAIKILETNTSH